MSGADVHNQAVSDRWNDLSPGDIASSFVETDERLVASWESCSDDELASMQVQPPFLPVPIDAASALGFRLSEVTLHGWDALAPSDPAATLAPDAAALLVDRLPMVVGFVGQFTPWETRPAEDTTITINTSEHERHFELELGTGADLSPVTGIETAASLDLPAALTLDDLRRACPGY